MGLKAFHSLLEPAWALFMASARGASWMRQTWFGWFGSGDLVLQSCQLFIYLSEHCWNICRRQALNWPTTFPVRGADCHVILQKSFDFGTSLGQRSPKNGNLCNFATLTMQMSIKEIQRTSGPLDFVTAGEPRRALRNGRTRRGSQIVLGWRPFASQHTVGHDEHILIGFRKIPSFGGWLQPFGILSIAQIFGEQNELVRIMDNGKLIPSWFQLVQVQECSLLMHNSEMQV